MWRGLHTGNSADRRGTRGGDLGGSTLELWKSVIKYAETMPRIKTQQPGRILVRSIPALLGLGFVMIVSGCASLAPPAGVEAQYFCRPDSAVRYRGAGDPSGRYSRPAPAHGSCRHQ